MKKGKNMEERDDRMGTYVCTIIVCLALALGISQLHHFTEWMDHQMEGEWNLLLRR